MAPTFVRRHSVGGLPNHSTSAKVSSVQDWCQAQANDGQDYSHDTKSCEEIVLYAVTQIYDIQATLYSILNSSMQVFLQVNPKS